LQAEDETKRLYYRVLVRAPRQEREGHDVEEGSDRRWREIIKEVDMSRILEFVSERELERFENNEFRLEAEADAAVKRDEAEEKVRKRLQRNAVAGKGKGSRMLNGVGIDEEDAAASSGPSRPRIRGRGSGSGRGSGRESGMVGGMLGSMAVALADLAEEDDEMPNEVAPEPIVPETEDEEAGEEEEEEENGADDAHISPIIRSSFVANSALPISPIAPRPHHEVAETEEEEEEFDEPMSSAAAQLISERRVHKRPSSDSEEKLDVEARSRPPAKRRRMQSVSIPRRPASLQHAIPAVRIPSVKRRVDKVIELQDPPSSSSSEESTSTRSTAAPESTAMHGNRPLHGHQSNVEEDQSDVEEDQEDVDEDQDDKETSEEEEIAIEAILSHSYRDGIKLYLVKWEGPDEATDWVPAADLENAPEMVAQYYQKIKRPKNKGTVRV
jgi:hypothetical protein